MNSTTDAVINHCPLQLDAYSTESKYFVLYSKYRLTAWTMPRFLHNFRGALQTVTQLRLCFINTEHP
jgi:hypothetical protein